MSCGALIEECAEVKDKVSSSQGSVSSIIHLAAHQDNLGTVMLKDGRAAPGSQGTELCITDNGKWKLEEGTWQIFY